MKRKALVLVVSSLWAGSLAAEPPTPLIQALLRVPVLRSAAPETASETAAALTGDETIDTLAMLSVTRSPAITAAVREQVMARLAGQPEILPQALDLLPDTPAAAAAAWDAFAALPPEVSGGDEFSEVRIWLRRHGEHFRAELGAAAKEAADTDGPIEGEEDLRAYARLEWAGAEPILKGVAAGAGRTAALAHALLYAHDLAGNPAAAIQERKTLQAIAEDRTASGKARDLAFEALTASEWPGSTEWYLAQFGDPTLLDPIDGSYGFSPLSHPVDRDPDLWIPRLVPLTLSKDRAIRSNAASLLGDFQLDRARADALKPLLPWLTDPAWAQEVSMERLRLVQSVGRIDLREAIPGLRWICRNDGDEDMRAYAADALLQLRAPDAMKEVRAVLARTDAMSRSELEQTLVASGALTDEEIVEMVTAYATLLSTEAGRKQLAEGPLATSGEPSSWKVTVGARLAADLPHREELAQRLLAKAAQSGEAAPTLFAIVSTIDAPAVHQWLATRLLDGTAAASGDPFPIVSLLQHRSSAAVSARSELQAALEKPGLARGIAAVVLNDGVSISAILRKGTADERDAVLAAARAVGQPLDTAEVLEAATNAGESAAAELEMMNTAAARAALATLYPDQARIWGPRPWADPGHTTFTFFDIWEESLRALVKKRQFDRIDALALGSYWGGNREVVVVARKGDTMLLVSTTPGTKETPLPPATAARIRQFLDDTHPADLEPFDAGTFDGTQYEYVYLTPDGGRRVFMNNPPSDNRDPHASVVEGLSSLVSQ
jgi:hypothetical protein